MRVFSITLAGSLLLAVISTVGVSGVTHPQAALSNSFGMPELTKQLAEAEETEEVVLTPVLIASWTTIAASSTTESPTATDMSRPNVSAPTPPRLSSPNKPIVSKTTSRPLSSSPVPIASKAPPAAKSGYSLVNVRKQIHSRTNTARSNNNLPALSSDSALASLAQKRSEEMVTKNYFSHTSPGGCDLACRFEGLGYSVYGENLAEYYEFASLTEPELAATFISMWLRSTGHKRNLLSTEYTREGVGVAMKGDRIVVTVIFAAE